MEFRILGPLEVIVEGRPLPLGGAKQRAVLALLLLHANQVVSTDRLIDALWGEKAPDTAGHTLQVHVSQLRKVVRAAGGGGHDDRLVTRQPGYILRVEPDELDLFRFERVVAEARESVAQGDVAKASESLRQALGLWRGPALADFAFEVFARNEIARLEDLRLAALEEHIEADLALGRHASLVGEIQALIASYPLRERLRAQLMLALYRCGRQAEALQAYQHARRVLTEELGIDPSPALQRLEGAILHQDSALDWTPPLPHPARARTSTGPVGTPTDVVSEPQAGSGGFVPGMSDPEPTEAIDTATSVTVLVEEQRPRAPERLRRPRRRVAALALVVLAAGVSLTAILTRGGGRPALTSVGINRVGGIDPITDEVTDSIPTEGNAPAAVAWYDGSVWVANTLTKTVARIDPQTRRVVETLSTDGTPTDMAVGEGAVWILDGFDGKVLRIDPARTKTTDTIPVPVGGGGIAVGEGAVWVTNALDGTVTKIDPRSNGVLASVPLPGAQPGGPGAVAAGGGAVWVVDALGTTVWRIDPRTDRVVSTPAVLAPSTKITIGPDGTALVTSMSADLVSRVDPSSLQAITIRVGHGPTGIAVGHGAAWVANSLDGTISRIDLGTNHVVAKIRVGNVPDGVAAGGELVWITVHA